MTAEEREGLRAKVERLRRQCDADDANGVWACDQVLEILAAPVEATELDRLRNLCAEMYQVAGTLGADARVLDTLSAVANGQPLPHGTLLPYAAPVEARAPQEAPAIDRLAPLPWYVEELRPGHDDEARVYDNRCMGVFKPTCDNPHARRPIAEAIVAAVNGLRAPQPAEPTRATDIDEDCCSDAPTGVHSPGCDHAGTPARPGMGSMTPEQSRFERAVKGDAAITRVAELEAKVATLTTELRTAQDAAQENWQDDKPLTEELAAALKLADSNLHPGRYPDPAFTIDGAEGPSHMHALVTALRELLKTHQTTCICAIHEAARAALAASEPASKPEKE